MPKDITSEEFEDQLRAAATADDEGKEYDAPIVPEDITFTSKEEEDDPGKTLDDLKGEKSDEEKAAEAKKLEDEAAKKKVELKGKEDEDEKPKEGETPEERIERLERKITKKEARLEEQFKKHGKERSEWFEKERDQVFLRLNKAEIELARVKAQVSTQQITQPLPKDKPVTQAEWLEAASYYDGQGSQEDAEICRNQAKIMGPPTTPASSVITPVVTAAPIVNQEISQEVAGIWDRNLNDLIEKHSDLNDEKSELNKETSRILKMNPAIQIQNNPYGINEAVRLARRSLEGSETAGKVSQLEKTIEEQTKKLDSLSRATTPGRGDPHNLSAPKDLNARIALGEDVEEELRREAEKADAL